MALKHLDEFVQSASEDELRLAERIVASRPQFRFDTNLSRHLSRPSLLNERSRSTGANRRRVRLRAARFDAARAHEAHAEAHSPYSRHGLAWVMALARVELGAMLAGYTSLPDPFRSTAPTEYETEAYREVLTDGLRSHYWSLKRDPAVANYPRSGVPERHIITYGRRLGMAQRFLEAAREFSRERISPAQEAELSAWDSEFRRFQLVLLYCLAQKMSVQGSSTHELTQQFVACPPLLQAARNELGSAIDDRRSVRHLGSFTFRLSDLLTAIDPTLVAVPCQHTPVEGAALGSRRRP